MLGSGDEPSLAFRCELFLLFAPVSLVASVVELAAFSLLLVTSSVADFLPLEDEPFVAEVALEEVLLVAALTEALGEAFVLVPPEGVETEEVGNGFTVALAEGLVIGVVEALALGLTLAVAETLGETDAEGITLALGDTDAEGDAVAFVEAPKPVDVFEIAPPEVPTPTFSSAPKRGAGTP